MPYLQFGFSSHGNEEFVCQCKKDLSSAQPLWEEMRKIGRKHFIMHIRGNSILKMLA